MATPRPEYRSRASPTDDVARGSAALNPLSQARVRDSAMRNNAAAELFEDGGTTRPCRSSSRRSRRAARPWAATIPTR